MDILSGSAGKYRKLMLAGQFWEQNDFASLEEYVDVCAKMQKPFIIFDLDRLTFINSQGLGLLVRLHRLCEDNGGKLIIFHPHQNIREVFEITGLGSFMTIIHTVKDLDAAIR